MNKTPEQAHCRICGSRYLNVANYISDISDRLDIQQVLTRKHLSDQLIKPCDCRGDFAYAHQVCLSEWLETTKHEFCDICRFKYNVRLLDKTIFDWVSETRQVRRILNVLYICALVYYISSIGILNHILSVRTPANLISIIVFASSCIWTAFCTIALVSYMLWLWEDFRCWRQANRRVLVYENQDPQLESEPRRKDILKSSGFNSSRNRSFRNSSI